jgi:hypothetical protein
LHTEQPEVSPKGAWTCVPLAQSPVGGVGDAKVVLESLVSRRNATDDKKTGLVVKITGKALELAGQTQDQRMVQLICHPPATPSTATERLVRCTQALDTVCASRRPRQQRR